MSDPVFGNNKEGSIRDIPLPGSEKQPLDLSSKSSLRDESLDNWNNTKRQNKRSFTKWIVLLAVFIGLFFALSHFMHKAEVTVWPKSASAPVVQTFTASETPTDGQLSFSRVAPFSGSQSIFIAGTQEENIQTKASGKILVKNTGSSSQRFIPNTRFETADGLVYRTPRSVVIPAGGEAEVSVSADVPGGEYNALAGLTFTIPGLKGSDAYNLFVGTQSAPFTGGFSGIIKTAGEAEIEAQKELLEETVRKTLRDELLTKVPTGFVVNDDLIYFAPIVFNEKPNEDKGGLDLVAEATIEAVMFKKEDFDELVAKAVLTDFVPGQTVEITNVPAINMLITSDDFKVQESNEFSFSLRSPQEGAQFVWQVNEDDIREKLAGNKTSFIERGLVSEMTEVEKMTIDVSPFWKSSVPKNTEKIDITIVTE